MGHGKENKVNETVGKYELRSLLGKGGFGNVWLACNKQTGELVALKLMQMPEDEQADVKARERFMREIEIAHLLDHPHVLAALDYGYVSLHGHTSRTLHPGRDIGRLLKRLMLFLKLPRLLNTCTHVNQRLSIKISNLETSC